MPAVKKAAVEVKPVLDNIRHIIRHLGPYTNDESGVQSFPDFELYLKETYLDDGWDIKHVQVLGSPDGKQTGLNYNPVEILYILVKRAA